MSQLMVSELPASDRSNVVAMRRPSALASSLAMRDAIKNRCETLHLNLQQTEDALSAAEVECAFGGSYAQGYRAGVAKAERTAAQMKVIRTRYGTRPDPEPPCAA